MCRISVGSQNISCDWQSEGRKQRMSMVDYVQFYHTEKLIDNLHAMLTVWVVSTNAFRGMWKTDFSIKWKMSILLHSASLQISLREPLLLVHNQFITQILSANVGQKHQHRHISRDCLLQLMKWWLIIKNNKNTANRSLKKFIQKAKTGKGNHRK